MGVVLSIVCIGYLLFKVWSIFIHKGYFQTKLFFANSPRHVTVRQAHGRNETGEESLREFVEKRCPSLLQDFRPPLWLFSGHQQTAYSVVGNFTGIDKVEYERTMLRTMDGGTLGLDFTPPLTDRKLADDTPIVVVLHGLTGGSYESYVRAVLAPVCSPREQGGLGYRAVVVNFRGCAGVPITSPQLYSAGNTEDIRVAVYYVKQRYPEARLLGLGFSLGANILTRYIAEEGEHSRLVAVCAVACPWDLLENNKALEGDWFHRTVYSSALGSNLQGIVKQHAASLSHFGNNPVSEVVAPCLALKSPTMEMFDDTFNRIGGGPSPPFPFPNARAYYIWASSHHVLPRVRVPFLALNAEDDPIVQVLPVKAGGNDYVAFAVTKKGGHLGWFAAGKRIGEVNRWFSQPVVEWLRAVGEDMVVSNLPGKPLHVVDGFIKEVGRDDIGCMEIEGGGRIVGTGAQEGQRAGL